LPNVGPYIYDVSISGFTRSSIYIHDISSLRVNIDPQWQLPYKSIYNHTRLHNTQHTLHIVKQF